MKVCFFGSYKQEGYNSTLKKILELQGVEVIECNAEIKGISSFLISYLKLLIKHMKVNYDIMIVPWRAVVTLPLAKIITRKPIVFFPFVSIFQTLVEDRKLIKEGSLTAKFLRFVDKTACKMSNMIILDTNENIDYFCNEFNLSKNKFRRLFVTVDEKTFFPLPIKKRNEIFNILFVGTFIPLHGINVIIESAKILSNKKDIIFTLIGNGQTRPQIEKMVNDYGLKNVKFVNSVKPEILPKFLRESDLCLGIFNGSKKAQSVIPLKILVTLASQKPLLTANSPSIGEAGLENMKNCILVKPECASELSKTILLLKENPKLLEQITRDGYELFIKKMSMEETGKVLVGYLQEFIRTNCKTI